jgi:hypothetical protein
LYTKDTVSISLKLARAGCVWPYKSKNIRNKTLVRAVEKAAKLAQQKQVGLWKPTISPTGDEILPVDPIIWRRMFRVVKFKGWQR